MLFELLLFVAIICTSTIIITYKMFFQRKNIFIKKSNQVIKFFSEILPILFIVFLIRSFAFEAFRIPSASMKPTLVEGDLILVDKYSHGVRLPILGTRLTKAGTPKRGDIVVFRGKVNGKSAGVIKRIVGLPGDKIVYHSNDKILYINGKPATQSLVAKEYTQDIGSLALRKQETFTDGTNGTDGKALTHEIYLYPAIAEQQYPYQAMIVPKDSYFVMGDNRDNSNDSRYWGVLKDRNLVGKARYIWLSLDWQQADSLFSWIKLNFVRWGRVGKLV